jgi:perosamine synthetase
LIATAMPILYVKAKPVFVDIEYNTGNIDATKIEEKITEKTKAIMIVDWGGYPCNLDETTRISKKYRIPIIQDAAHSLGGEYKGEEIGNQSNFTCFSFQAIKHLTTGDGGAVCSLNEEHETELKKLRWFNIDRERSKLNKLGEREYNLYNAGYKYHMNDIAATLGIDNLKIIKPIIGRVQNIAKKYDEGLKGVDGIIPFKYASNRKSAYWLYGFHVERRKYFLDMMNRKNIFASVVHMGIDKNKVLGGYDGTLINQRKFDATHVHIPINYNMSDRDVDHIISTIKSGW